MKKILWLKARLIFYPTLFWNMLLGRWLKTRNWYDLIAPHVIVGAFPFRRDVAGLAANGVRAVVNTCEEYGGPLQEYDQHGIEQFHMPTIDFTHPAYDDVVKAVEFIEANVRDEKTVYIHCKAGRGRSATVAICWLMKHFGISASDAQKRLLDQRPHVNARLTERPVVKRFEAETLK
jgi:atypical dual specificity phosphatase